MKRSPAVELSNNLSFLQVPVRDFPVAWTLSVHRQTRHSACVSPGSRATRNRVVSMSTSVPAIRALMQRAVSMKREDTNVFVRTEWLEIPTEEDVSIVDTIKALIYFRDNKSK